MPFDYQTRLGRIALSLKERLYSEFHRAAKVDTENAILFTRQESQIPAALEEKAVTLQAYITANVTTLKEQVAANNLNRKTLPLPTFMQLLVLLSKLETHPSLVTGYTNPAGHLEDRKADAAADRRVLLTCIKLFPEEFKASNLLSAAIAGGSVAARRLREDQIAIASSDFQTLLDKRRTDNTLEQHCPKTMEASMRKYRLEAINVLASMFQEIEASGELDSVEYTDGIRQVFAEIPEVLVDLPPHTLKTLCEFSETARGLICQNHPEFLERLLPEMLYDLALRYEAIAEVVANYSVLYDTLAGMAISPALDLYTAHPNSFALFCLALRDTDPFELRAHGDYETQLKPFMPHDPAPLHTKQAEGLTRFFTAEQARANTQAFIRLQEAGELPFDLPSTLPNEFHLEAMLGSASVQFETERVVSPLQPATTATTTTTTTTAAAAGAATVPYFEDDTDDDGYDLSVEALRETVDYDQLLRVLSYIFNDEGATKTFANNTGGANLVETLERLLFETNPAPQEKRPAALDHLLIQHQQHLLLPLIHLHSEFKVENIQRLLTDSEDPQAILNAIMTLKLPASGDSLTRYQLVTPIAVGLGLNVKSYDKRKATDDEALPKGTRYLASDSLRQIIQNSEALTLWMQHRFDVLVDGLEKTPVLNPLSVNEAQYEPGSAALALAEVEFNFMLKLLSAYSNPLPPEAKNKICRNIITRPETFIALLQTAGSRFDELCNFHEDFRQVLTTLAQFVPQDGTLAENHPLLNPSAFLGTLRANNLDSLTAGDKFFISCIATTPRLQATLSKADLLWAREAVGLVEATTKTKSTGFLGTLRSYLPWSRNTDDKQAERIGQLEEQHQQVREEEEEEEEDAADAAVEITTAQQARQEEQARQLEQQRQQEEQARQLEQQQQQEEQARQLEQQRQQEEQAARKLEEGQGEKKKGEEDADTASAMPPSPATTDTMATARSQAKEQEDLDDLFAGSGDEDEDGEKKSNDSGSQAGDNPFSDHPVPSGESTNNSAGELQEKKKDAKEKPVEANAVTSDDELKKDKKASRALRSRGGGITGSSSPSRSGRRRRTKKKPRQSSPQQAGTGTPDPKATTPAAQGGNST